MHTIAKPDLKERDDIDLVLLSARGFSFLKRYKWIYLTAILVGIAWGTFKYMSSPKLYSSEMIVHSYILTNLEQIGIADNWNELLQKKEYASLASIFNCNTQLLPKVRQIKAEELLKVYAASNPNGFLLSVIVADNDILPELQKGIVYGFENGNYVKEKMEARRAILRELIIKSESEIASLDSTRKVMEHILNGTERPASSLIVDGSSMNRQSIEMNEKLLRFKEELRFTNPIQVLQGFNSFSQPASPNLTKLVMIGALAFFAVSYFLTLFHSLWRKWNRNIYYQSNGER